MPSLPNPCAVNTSAILPVCCFFFQVLTEVFSWEPTSLENQEGSRVRLSCSSEQKQRVTQEVTHEVFAVPFPKLKVQHGKLFIFHSEFKSLVPLGSRCMLQDSLALACVNAVSFGAQVHAFRTFSLQWKSYPARTVQ